MDKNLRKEIRAMADKMPVSYYSADQKKLVKGSVLLSKDMQEYGGKPIDPELKYWVTVETAYPVNHFRRLIKAYIDNGTDGLIAYVKGQKEIHSAKPPIKLN